MTILGLHTAHELSDLLTNKDEQIKAMQAQLDKLPPTSDPLWVLWGADWAKFSSDWNTVANKWSAIISDDKASVKGWDYTTEEDGWNELLAVFGGPYGTVESDLFDRWSKLPGQTNPQPSLPNTQPTAQDSDLNVFNAAGQVTIPLDKAGKAIGGVLGSSALPYIIGGVLGLVGIVAIKRVI